MTIKEEKELIDYKIEANRKAKEKNLSDWNKAASLVIIIIIILAIIVKCAES